MTPRCSASRACRTSRLETDDTSVTPKTTNTKRTEGGWKATRNRRQNGWRQFFLRDNLLSNWLFHPILCRQLGVLTLTQELPFAPSGTGPSLPSAPLCFFSKCFLVLLVASSPLSVPPGEKCPCTQRAPDNTRELHGAPESAREPQRVSWALCLWSSSHPVSFDAVLNIFGVTLV